MLRTTGFAFASLLLFACSLTQAQEHSIQRKPTIADRIRAEVRAIAPDDDAAADESTPKRTPTQRLRDAVKARTKKLEQKLDGESAALAELGATRPFDYTANRRFLVATVQDGGGLALFEPGTAKLVRRLEDSHRPYSLVAICPHARWIAGVWREEPERIDVWNAETGRHLHWLRTAEGPIAKLEFHGENNLRAITSKGQLLTFDVKAGALVEAGENSSDKSARRPRGRKSDENPTLAAPAAPSTTQSIRSSEPTPTLEGEETASEPSLAAPPRMSAPTIELPPPPLDAGSRIGSSRKQATSRVPRDSTLPPPISAAPSIAPAEPPMPAAPSTTAPWLEPQAPAMAEPTFEPAPAIEAAPSLQPSFPAAAAPSALAPDEPPMDEDAFEPEGLSPGAATGSEAAQQPDWVQSNDADGEFGSADSDEPSMAAPDEPAMAMPDEPAAAAPEEEFTGAAPSEPVGGAAPEVIVDEAAPPPPPEDETSSEVGAEPGLDDAEPPTAARQFRFEMNADEAPAESATTESAPGEASPTTPSTEKHALAEVPPPATVDIHYATNRNRLAPKDREWLVYFTGFFSSLPAFVIYGLVVLSALVLPWFGKRSWALTGALVGGVVLCAMGTVEAYVRSQLRDEMSGELYGCRPTEISYGKCTISVPPPQNRRPGELSRPLAVWVFEAPENPDEHFLLKKVEEHADKDAFYRSLSAKLDQSDTRAAMLFVHGYNVSFEDAIFRTAQLAVDLKFPGATMAFCWPSYADPVKYTFDEQNAEVSIPALREVLDDLATRSGAKRVHIIAHSMGNRVLAGALRSMDPSLYERNKSVFQELVLAAPDIDSRVFQSQVLPHIVHNTQHCTLYASSRDRALLMSRVFHNYQRLGETEPELVLAHGLDTIDASLVDTSLLGHSYIGDVQSIVSDLRDLVVEGKRATERMGLELLERQALHYWLIKPEVQTAAERPLVR